MTDVPEEVMAELARLRADNARLLAMLRLSPQQAAAPAPAQAGAFEAPPGLVHRHSPDDVKVAFFGSLFAARTDVYAIAYDNPRTGAKGWYPAVKGGRLKGVPHEDRHYLPLTPDVIRAHLTGRLHLGLYPMLQDDTCWWLAADFDGQDAITDALMYLKAGRALQVPVALEVSRSGTGAHAWVFFTSPVPAELARRMGAGLLRGAMALRRSLSLSSYDRLFPAQDLLPAGGFGNLIAAPLFQPARNRGATVFLDLQTLEPHQDQWAFLSTLGRMTPAEVRKAAGAAGKVAVAAEVTRLAPAATAITQVPAVVVHARLGAGIRVELADLTPALAAALRHAASMHNPEFYERQRMRRYAGNLPRFLHFFDETLDGGLILPRGLLPALTALVEQAGSALQVTDERAAGTPCDLGAALLSGPVVSWIP